MRVCLACRGRRAGGSRSLAFPSVSRSLPGTTAGGNSMTLRLRQICLVAPHLEPSVSTICTVLGTMVTYVDPNVEKYGLVNALMPFGNSFLEVVAPTQDGTAAGRYLDRRGGGGGYMVILDCDDI